MKKQRLKFESIMPLPYVLVIYASQEYGIPLGLAINTHKK
jgi:hypothetical protein